MLNIGGGAPRSLDPPVTLPEGLGDTLQAAGDSEEAACTICNSKRQSMRDLCDTKWWSLSRWYHEQQIDTFIQLRSKKVVDHLENLAAVPLEHNTILTHISALGSCTCGCKGASMGIHPLVSAWVVGHKVHCPPKQLKIHLGICRLSWLH